VILDADPNTELEPKDSSLLANRTVLGIVNPERAPERFFYPCPRVMRLPCIA